MRLYIITISLCLIMGYADPVSRDTMVGFYNISHLSFRGASESSSWIISRAAFKGVDQGVYYAPFALPDSAKIIEMRAWVADGYTIPMELYMYRSNRNNTVSEKMAEVWSVAGGGFQVIVDSTIDYDIVDNLTYIYNCEVLFRSSGQQMKGIRIKYETYSGNPAVNEDRTTSVLKGTISASPSPFTQQTEIQYSVSYTSDITMTIYDGVGRLIRTLVDCQMSPGVYTARWDGRDTKGNEVPNGSYFCVTKNNGSSTTQIIFIK